MKRKYAAMVLGLTLALTSMNVAYAAEKDTTTATEAADTEDTETADTSTDETASDEVYGEVTEVGEDSITIDVGTLKEGQQPGGDQKPGDGENRKMKIRMQIQMPKTRKPMTAKMMQTVPKRKLTTVKITQTQTALMKNLTIIQLEQRITEKLLPCWSDRGFTDNYSNR